MTPTPTTDSAVSPVSVDDLAQEIRRIDGNNEKSAGYLAEAIMSFLASPPSPATDWLSTDDAETSLFQAIWDIKIGNKTDDKLILENLRKSGVWLARFPLQLNKKG